LPAPALPFVRPAVGYLAPLDSRIDSAAEALIRVIRVIRGPIFPILFFHVFSEEAPLVATPLPGTLCV
jgi:hypothetical protein